MEDDSSLSWFGLTMFAVVMISTTANLYMINEVSRTVQEMRGQVSKIAQGSSRDSCFDTK